MKSKWLKLTYKQLLIGAFALPLFLHGKTDQNSLYQLSTQEAFLAGNTAPLMNTKALKAKGNFGLGFLDRQNIFTLYDGKFYKSLDDGSLASIDENEGIAFAQVTEFHSIKHFDISAIGSYENLLKELMPHLENWNIPYSIIITGTFNYIKLAAKNSQQKPMTIEERSIAGSLVGFWIPNSLDRLSHNGFRFHFISQDRKKGGHVLEVAPSKGICALAPLYFFNLEFPQSKEFATTRF